MRGFLIWLGLVLALTCLLLWWGRRLVDRQDRDREDR